MTPPLGLLPLSPGPLGEMSTLLWIGSALLLWGAGRLSSVLGGLLRAVV